MSVVLIFVIIVTIASILLVFTLYAGRTDQGRKTYCDTLYKLRTAVWQETRDDFCDQEAFTMEAMRIDHDIEDTVLKMIMACWTQSANGRKEADILCSEIIIPAGAAFSPLTEADLTGMLIDREQCHLIENSFDDSDASALSCGSKNQIRFLKPIVAEQKILIEYDAQARQIIVS